MVQPVQGRDHGGISDPGLLDDVSPIRIPACRWHAVPLCEGGPAAFVNAVIDAIGSAQVRNIDMPLLPDRVYEALTQRRDVSGAPPVMTDD